VFTTNGNTILLYFQVLFRMIFNYDFVKRKGMDLFEYRWRFARNMATSFSLTTPSQRLPANERQQA
jgi:hypothetical protein